MYLVGGIRSLRLVRLCFILAENPFTFFPLGVNENGIHLVRGIFRRDIVGSYDIFRRLLVWSSAIVPLRSWSLTVMRFQLLKNRLEVWMFQFILWPGLLSLQESLKFFEGWTFSHELIGLGKCRFMREHCLVLMDEERIDLLLVFLEKHLFF